ncbi:N-6 DNA methylase, partial [Thiorhodovibrio winogradskyi]
AACSIRGAKDAPKYKDYILPLIFTKRLCDVFDDELNRIAAEVGSRRRAFALAKADHKLVRFYLPLLQGIIDRVTFNATTQSAGEFYTPPEVGTIMSRVLAPEPGMEIYNPCCGSGGLLIKFNPSVIGE